MADNIPDPKSKSKKNDFPESPKNHVFGRFGEMKMFDPKKNPKNITEIIFLKTQFVGKCTIQNFENFQIFKNLIKNDG